MANLFGNLPATAGDGSGAALDTTDYGKIRTITVQDAFRGTLNIEGSLDGGTTWETLVTFTNPGVQVISIACNAMRATRSGVPEVNPGLPNVDVASNDNGGVYAALAAPAGNGSGASTDISTQGTFHSCQVDGPFRGTVSIQISEDGTDWATVLTFTAPGIQSKAFVAQFARVTRTGVPEVNPGTPVVNLGAINDSGSGGGGGSAGNVFVFQPGGGGEGPSVFEDWDELVAALDMARTEAGVTQPTGFYVIEFDDRFEPCVIPSGPEDDMEGVIWAGQAAVTVSADKTFANLRKILGALNINLDSAANAAPVSDLVSDDIVEISGGGSIVCDGTPPFFQINGTPTVSFKITDFTIGDGTRDVINQAAGSTVILYLFDSATISVAAITNAAASILFVGIYGNSARIGQQAGAAGSNSVETIASPRWNPTTVTSPQLGDTVLLTNPPSTVTLPTLRAPFTNGQTVVVKVAAADNGLVTINAAGGQTVDGASSYTFFNTSGYGCVVLEADGTNWNVLSQHKRPPQFNVEVPSSSPHTATFGAYVPVPSAPYTVNLPALSSPATDGQSIIVKLNANDPDTVTITPNGANTIDGSASFTFNDPNGYGSVTLIASGTNWGVN